MRKRLFLLIAAVFMTVAATLGSGVASAAPQYNSMDITTPSPYPWEAPIALHVDAGSSLISYNEGPYVARLGINFQPPTTDPLYSQQLRLLNYATHTEIHWRNTTTGASGTATSDQAMHYPWGGATIDTGLGWVEYTVVASTGAIFNWINPQVITFGGALEVSLDQPY